MFENVPWLVPLVSWILAVLVVWLLASIPAVAVRRLTTSFRHGARALADRTFDSFRSAQAERHSRIAASKQALLEGFGERPFDEAVHEQWLSDIVAIAAPMDQARADFAASQTQNNKLLSEITAVKDKLGVVSGGGDLPEIPSAKDAIAMQRERSAAMLNLWVGGALLIPIVVYNAQLTAAVIRDAVPNVQGVIAGIPPALAIAIAITLAEAGIGAAHGNSTEEGEETGRQYTIVLMVLTLLAVLVVGMEFLLYSQLRENSGEFNLPLFDVKVPPGTAFGLIGLVLGSAVFFLGRMTYTGARTLTKRRAIASVLSRYEALRGAARQLNDAASDRAASLNQLYTQMNRFQEQLRERRLLLSVSEVDDKVRSLLEVKPAWIQPTRKPLTSGEVIKLESSAFFSIAASIVSLLLVAGGVSSVVAVVAPALSTPIALTVGALLGLIFLYTGFGLGSLHRERSWKATSARPVVVLALIWGGVVLGYLIASLTSWPIVSLVAMLAVAISILMVLVGVGLQASGPFAFVLIRSWIIVALWVPLVLLLSTLYFAWLIATVLDEMVGMLAQPAYWVSAVFAKPRPVL